VVGTVRAAVLAAASTSPRTSPVHLTTSYKAWEIAPVSVGAVLSHFECEHAAAILGRRLLMQC
jgi:hypothetical protein